MSGMHKGIIKRYFNAPFSDIVGFLMDGSGNSVMTVSTIAGVSVCLPTADVVGSSSNFLTDKERTKPIYLVFSLVIEGLWG